jgi:PAS domain S-box-containing protein
MSVARQAAANDVGQLVADLVLASFEAVGDSLMLVEDGRILLANPACVKLLGYDNGAALAGQPVNLVFAQSRFCWDLSQSPGNLQCEHPSCEPTLRRADGGEVRARAQCTRFQYRGRALILVALREFKRVELERMVRDNELRFRPVFEAAAIGISTCTLDGRMIESNPAVSKMLGYTAQELAGMHARELHPGDFEQDEALLKELLSGLRDSFDLEKRFRRKDGSYLWGHVTVSLVRNAGGEPAFIIAMLEDIAERKRAEEQLRAAEKMEVIGRLAGGVAHDFNNLLTGILLYCDLVLSGAAPDDRSRPHVEQIRLAGEQGAALTQQLLAFARKQVPQPRTIVLNEVVSSTENLLRRLLGEQIVLATVLGPNLGTVRADPGQLRQVILNLVLNARDAMPHGGRITVSTHAAQLPDASHPAAALVVEDTGSGMDAETRAHLFEPFFTTKKAGEGTGLGLATVQRIVNESGGAIQVESEIGRGTRISVLLPALNTVTEPAGPAVAARSGETILLVDDHASARDSMRSILHRSGYRVLTASSGKAAVQVFEENAGAVDLLIADWMMPGMTGQELAEHLRRRQPGLKVLLISGYEDATGGAPVALIRKPFAGNTLIERTREVLDSNGEMPC